MVLVAVRDVLLSYVTLTEALDSELSVVRRTIVRHAIVRNTKR